MVLSWTSKTNKNLLKDLLNRLCHPSVPMKVFLKSNIICNLLPLCRVWVFKSHLSRLHPSPSLLHRSGHNVHSVLVLLAAVLPLSTPHTYPKLQSSPFQFTLSSREGTKGEGWKGQSLSVELAGESLGSVVHGRFHPGDWTRHKASRVRPMPEATATLRPHAGGKGSGELQNRRNPAIYNHLPKGTAPVTYGPESHPVVTLQDLWGSQPRPGHWADSGSPIVKDVDKDIPGNRKYSVFFPACNCKPVFSTYFIYGSR